MTEHAHAHAHIDPDWAALAAELEAEATTLAPYATAAFEAIAERVPAPGTALDVGAGPGVLTDLLAARFPTARVIAVDGAEPLLDRARERAAAAGRTVETLRTDLPGGVADLPAADVIWTAQTLHHLGDQSAAIAALAGRLNPGGVLAVAEGGLPLRFLPRDIGLGRPGLAERLDALQAEGFGAMRAALEGTVDVPEDWPALLRAAGLRDVRARTFLVDRPAPLDPASRDAVARMMGRYLRMADRLAPDDAEVLRRLTDPGDPHNVRRRPDAFVLAARTVYIGTAP
ncbi:SAM-dependent methyltransferase [Tsukamurella pulmonis]|uniref:Ubiquinone/menaquinone biosynthesis C-methylase UbiE n=1 Tax=Tsukamurella pulmonis TaxID=47312 RepID=A0A1H1F7J0_9ACTN|nr:class I SAM-dependent methyltransferase [Tsukamurella pulmonis]KXO88655.1 SAM-dependent methyltransferase [Tsukamurella pulmonis]SDQ96880.1 Ubiquinone/menaquinone biosynthesis C-methylase UbiE [Tsukamurella pulmonis]SUP19962.1 Trans-aconitate 2-methyltransferase [Tsukamurella pulmonis]